MIVSVPAPSLRRPRLKALPSMSTPSVRMLEPGVESLSALPNTSVVAVEKWLVTSYMVYAPRPNVPTASEAGLPGYEANAWYAIVVPKGTPPEVKARINEVMNAWLKTDKAKALLAQNGAEAAGGSPEDLHTFIQGELGKWGPLIKAAKIEF